MLSFQLFLCSLFILSPVLSAQSRPPSVTVFRDSITPSEPSVIRSTRHVTAATDSDYLWKSTKTPTFITTQLKKQLAEPILNVFPSEGAFRNGKSGEIFLPEYNSGRRIIYHTTLPDVPSHATRSPYNPYTGFILPSRSDQRSYDANKGGHQFVTRVRSPLINIAGEDKDKGNQKANPSFMIIENPSPQYPVNSLNRIMQPVGYHNNHMTGISYHHQSPYHAHQRPYISDFKLPYSGSLPHFNAANDFGIPQSPYQHQSSPYYEEVEKIHTPGHEHPHNQNYAQRLTSSSSPFQSLPYPSRHIRFPSNRYPLNSAFNDLLPSSKPYTTSLNSNPLDSGFLQHSSNLGFGDGISTNPSGFNVNNNLGPVTMDYNLDLDGNKFASKPFSQRNKYSNLNKYLDTSNGLHSDFPNSPFSDKPFDDFEDFSSLAAEINDRVKGDKDFHIKGSSSFAETQNDIGNTVNSTAESDNTVKTPLATSLSETSTEENQAESDYQDEANSS